jgi:uncharacterized membrane protein YeiH
MEPFATAAAWKGDFSLPPSFDIGAIFFFALTGVLAAVRRGYDFIGLFTMAFVTGLGGALIRDGIFLQNGPPALMRDSRYFLAVIAGCIVGWIVGTMVERFRTLIAVLDAIGLGAYSVVGVSKSLAAGLSIPAAILVGVVNAGGGGLLRDILVREEALMLKPGQFYTVASLLGCGVFVSLLRFSQFGTTQSAFIAIGVTFIFRIAAIIFDWRTAAIQPWRTPAEIALKEKPTPPASSGG